MAVNTECVGDPKDKAGDRTIHDRRRPTDYRRIAGRTTDRGDLSVLLQISISAHVRDIVLCTNGTRGLGPARAVDDQGSEASHNRRRSRMNDIRWSGVE